MPSSRVTSFVEASLLLAALPFSRGYCEVGDSCWPSSTEWTNLENELSSNALYNVNNDISEYDDCDDQTDAFGLEDNVNGVCMQYTNCKYEYCVDGQAADLPAYTVAVQTVGDIQAVLAFASQHNIAVTVKTSGHSYSGSSTAANSILIWTREFLGNNVEIKSNYNNTCATTFPDAISVGGGNTWGEVYSTVQDSFNVVGGGALSVGAAGGWLAGGGLSALSRKYGYGIDNVIDFDVVLPNGTLAHVDACENPDLFWALRGGGGGTFGVVTNVHYQLHPVEPIKNVYMSITWEDNDSFGELVQSWWDFWVENSQTLSNNWGGYWTLSSAILYHTGELSGGDAFVTAITAWKDDQSRSDLITVTETDYISYWDAHGRGEKTDETGFEFDIGSRLVPRSYVESNTDDFVDLLDDISNAGFFTWNYFLGGATEAVDGDDTSMHPAARTALYQIEVVTEQVASTMDLVRNIPNSGSGYNHGYKLEPDWKNAFWGDNYDRLLSIKQQVDPNNTLNCWHCVGYVGEEPDYDSLIDDETDISVACHLSFSLAAIAAWALCW